MEQKNSGVLRTRLAPTPSGLLHAGNGVSFLVTWCLARAAGGRVFLRIDDLDKGRRRREYLEDIFRTIDWLGIDYDEGPSGPDDFLKNFSQHHRLDLYQEALDRLRALDLLYACTCTRRQISERSETGLYPLTCRDLQLPFEGKNAAWRLRVPEDTAVGFSEWGQKAPLVIRLAEFMGDFVVRQKNRLAAYQLASLVDDLHYDINFVVRGEDLKISTAAQTYLAGLLEETRFQDITFRHHGLLTGPDGEKLSKSRGAGSLQAWREAARSPQALYRQAAEWLSLPEEAGLDLETLVAGVDHIS